MAPGVADLMKTGSDAAQVGAARALWAQAQSSPAVRESCIASLREVVNSGEDECNECLRQAATASLEQLSGEA